MGPVYSAAEAVYYLALAAKTCLLDKPTHYAVPLFVEVFSAADLNCCYGARLGAHLFLLAEGRPCIFDVMKIKNMYFKWKFRYHVSF